MNETTTNEVHRIRRFPGILKPNGNEKDQEVENQIIEAHSVTAANHNQYNARGIHEKVKERGLNGIMGLDNRMRGMKAAEPATHRMANTKKGNIQMVDEGMTTMSSQWKRRSAVPGRASRRTRSPHQQLLFAANIRR